MGALSSLFALFLHKIACKFDYRWGGSAFYIAENDFFRRHWFSGNGSDEYKVMGIIESLLIPVG